MNSIWNKNISSFKKRFPKLAEIYNEQIKNFEKDILSNNQFQENHPFWKIKNAKNGEITASENEIFLHSTYAPSKEAFSAINQKEVLGKSGTVFFGFGLGYHLIEWAKLYKKTDKKLIIIEPDCFHFFSALIFLDWTEVFEVEHLIIALSCLPEEILSLIENSSQINIGNSGVSDCFFFNINAFTKHSQNYFETVKILIDRNIQKNKINEATLKKFGKLWCRNSKKNLLELKNHDFINDFENKTNLPFLIIGAGPSLKNIIPHLHQLQKKMITICVETALHTLLENKIEPDFIIILDPQYWAYKHIAALKSPKSILITEISVYPSVFRFLCKKILLCHSQFPIGQYFEKKLNLSIGDLGTGGSVASSAWNFARFCGSKKIYFAGLDLAFPEKQTHIKGSSAEQNFHKISNKILTAEKLNINSLFSAFPKISQNYLEKPVLTDSKMEMFAWWFESKIASFPEIKNFTLCPEGLKIPGVNIKKIEEILNFKDITEQKDDFLSQSSQKADFSHLQEIINSFPNQEFLSEYPFLKDFL